MKKAFQIIGILIIVFSFMSPQPSYGQVKIGDVHDDGIIFYIDDTGKHGLVCQTKDLEGLFYWSDAIDACEKLGNGWHLPTKDELNLMYNNLNKRGLGGFHKFSWLSSLYWSSDEIEGDTGWSMTFFNGDQGETSKDISGYARPVRAF